MTVAYAAFNPTFVSLSYLFREGTNKTFTFSQFIQDAETSYCVIP